jgi:hypothetical protein
LACILALDGFYVDGRNIRASYGTSKYCSAFIKNVRCNNPDCTYLHCMGDSEDTFTKQEIQAGYVTSGRDVLARQQQLAAATAPAGSTSRRRVGSGGPSGTGKVASNPVFPPPTFEEPPKPSHTNLVPPLPPATSSTTQFPPVGSAAMQRSISNGIAGFSSVAAGNGSSSVAPTAKMSRSSSVPLSTSLPAAKPVPALTPAEMLSRQQEELRKRHPQNSTNTNNKKAKAASTANAASADQQSSSQSNGIERSAPVPAANANTNAPPSTTAASIVAGVHSTSKPGTSQPAPHTTLTALTPLKRASSLPEKKELPIPSKSSTMGTSSDSLLLSQNIQGSKALSSSQQAAFFDQRKNIFVNGGQPRDTSMKLSALRSNSTTLANDSNVSATATMKAPAPVRNSALGIGSIGGQVIGGSASAPIGALGAPIGSFGNSSSSLGNIMNSSSSSSLLGSIGPSFLGMKSSNISGKPIGGFEVSGSGAIGGSNILSQPLLSGGTDRSQFGLGESKANGNISDGLFGGSDFGSIGGTGLWDQSAQNNVHRNSSGPANGGIGGTLIDDKSQSLPPTFGQSNIPRDNVSGSSALASMLGIELPTGVGSLRETLWASSTPLKDPFSEVKTNTPTPIGAGIKKSNVIGGRPSRNVPIGGYEIGGQSHMSSGGVPIGGYGSSTGPATGGNRSDVALLQSLLPGVHITSRNAYQPAATQNPNIFAASSDWNGLSNSKPIQQQSQMLVGGLMANQHHQEEAAWNKGGYSTAPPPPKEGNTRKQNQSNIW